MISNTLKATLIAAEAALTPEQRCALSSGLATLASELTSLSTRQACLGCEDASFWIGIEPNQTAWYCELQRCDRFIDVPKDQFGRLALPDFFVCSARKAAKDE